MAVAVSKALESGAPGVVCASTGNTAASAAAYAARAGIEAVIVHAGRRGRRAGRSCRCARPARGSCRSTAPSTTRSPPRSSWRSARATRVVNSTNPHRLEGQKTAAFEIVEQLGGPPDVLALPVRRRRQHGARTRKGFVELGEPLPRLVPVQAARARRRRSRRRSGSASPCTRDEVEAAVARHGRRGRHASTTTRSSRRGGRSRGRRACSASRPRPPRSPASARGSSRPGARVVCVLTGHGLRTRRSSTQLAADEPARPRTGDDRQPRPRLRLRRRRARALERGRDQRRRADVASTQHGLLRTTSRSGPSRASHPTDGLSFSFTDRIPRERGLGSSAATVALGLVAGALAAGREPDPEELLALGVDLEGHPDNLAAALAGGVCLTWDGRIARIADRLPARADRARSRTSASAPRRRARRCPRQVPHADAAHTAGARHAPRRRDRERLGRALRRRARRPPPRAVPRRERAAARGRPGRPPGGRARRDASPARARR